MIRIYLLLAVVFWGTSFVFTKILLAYVTPVELLGLRFLTGLPVLLVVVAAKRITLKFASRDRWQLLLAAAILTFHFLIQITGLQYTSATNTGWIISVSPLVLAVLSFLILKEKIGWKEILGIITATFGILLLVSGGRLGDLGWLSSVGDWLVLGSAHTWALYTVATRDIARKYHPLAVTLAILLPSAIGIIGYMLFTSNWGSFLHLPLEPVVALLILGILALAVGQWLWQEGVAKLGATRAGIYLYLEPLATTALAVPYLHEKFGLLSALGGGLVLGGVYIAQRKQKKSNQKII